MSGQRTVDEATNPLVKLLKADCSLHTGRQHSTECSRLADSIAPSVAVQGELTEQAQKLVLLICNAKLKDFAI